MTLRRRIDALIRRRPHQGDRFGAALDALPEHLCEAVARLGDVPADEVAPHDAHLTERWPALSVYTERMAAFVLPPEGTPRTARAWYLLDVPEPSPDALADARAVLAEPMPDGDPLTVDAFAATQWWAHLAVALHASSRRW